MTQILNFPQNENTFPASAEEGQEHIQSVRREFCNEIASDVMDAALSVLMTYGIQVKPTGNAVKDIVFLEESIKAMLYRNKNMEHPFHSIIESSIMLPDEMTDEKISESIKETKLT